MSAELDIDDVVAGHPRATADLARLRKIEKAACKVVARLDRTEMSYPIYKELAELLPEKAYKS